MSDQIDKRENTKRLYLKSNKPIGGRQKEARKTRLDKKTEKN